MNETDKISPDDPRLTAYALGEMEPAEHAAFERALQQDAAARASVDEIRATVAALGAALDAEAAETKPALVAPVRAAASAGAREERRATSTLLTFPRFYYVAAGLAAACFALVYVVDDSRTRAAQAQLAAEKSVVHHETATGAGAMARVAPASPDQAPAPVARSAASTLFALGPAETRVPDRFFAATESTTSTFPLQLGKASYARVSDALRRGERPAKETVHVAEMINAFNYTWPEAAPGESFATLLEETAAPWAVGHRLVRVGLKGVGNGEIARAAQVEVEFNPARVRAWRLIGFERDENFIGLSGGNYGETMRGGDTVTALYEVVPSVSASEDAADRTLLRVALHYLDAASGERRTIARQLQAGDGGFARASEDLKFIAAVAAFGLALRESPLQPASGLTELTTWAEAGAGADPQRREFLGLMQRARGLLP